MGALADCGSEGVVALGGGRVPRKVSEEPSVWGLARLAFDCAAPGDAGLVLSVTLPPLSDSDGVLLDSVDGSTLGATELAASGALTSVG